VLDCAADSPALITFTSGSTGQSKAVVRTHGFLLAQHEVLHQTLAPAPGEVFLATLPIFVFSHLASGVTSVIADADLHFPEKVRPEPVIEQVEACAVTCIVASPAFLERFVECCANRNRTLPRLKRIYVGGGPVFPRLVDQLHQIAPAAEIVVVYGSSEAEPISLMPQAKVRSPDIEATANGRGLLVGAPVDAIKVRVLPDRWGTPIGPYDEADFATNTLPPEQSGEIVVQGKHVLGGYLQDEWERAIKFRVGNTIWHRTGDAGYLDVRGRLWLLGRCAARIDDSRGSLYPLAVEGTVSDYACIRRAAFFSQRGRRILAIETYDHRSDSDLVNDLMRRLAGTWIDEVRILRCIPTDKRHNAKIDYPALLRLADPAR
jgi:acyl-CoA synthetase (AMP-forming)/AMP-acid ligase II